MPAVTHSPTGGAGGALGRQAASQGGGGANTDANAANDARAPPPPQAPPRQQQQPQPKPTSGAPGGDVYATRDPGPGAPLLCALAWSVRADAPFRLAAGTFSPPVVAAASGASGGAAAGRENAVEVLRLYEGASNGGNANGGNANDNSGGHLAPDRRLLPLLHPFPAACVQFLPDRDPSRPDLLASCADVVRVWRLGDGGGGGGGDEPAAAEPAADDTAAAPPRSSGVVRMLTKPPPTTAAASDSKAPPATSSAAAPATAAAPLTCLDWCGASGGRRLVATSLDGTAAVWDVEAGGAPIAWVRAHPGGAAHGCCWSGGGGGGGGGAGGGTLPASPDIFATCGGGGGGSGSGRGSVRVFDLRDGCKRAAVLFELPADGEGVEAAAAEGEEEEEGGKAAAGAAAGAEEAEEDEKEDGPSTSDEDEDDENEEEKAAATATAAAAEEAPPPPSAPADQQQQQQRKRRRRRKKTKNTSPSIVRVAWSAADPRYLACVPQSSPSTLVLDVRFPATPLAVLCRHRAAVNAVAWSPADAAALVTAGDDAQALIWDLSGAAGVVVGAEAGAGGGGGAEGGGGAGGGGGGGGGNGNGNGGGGSGIDPILTWVGESEVHALQWSTAQPDWIALACGKRAQIMLV